jgi:hypothetical protein
MLAEAGIHPRRVRDATHRARSAAALQQEARVLGWRGGACGRGVSVRVSVRVSMRAVARPTSGFGA